MKPIPEYLGKDIIAYLEGVPCEMGITEQVG